jgi:hypothetical protein
MILVAAGRTWRAARCPAGPFPADPCIAAVHGPVVLDSLGLVALAAVLGLFAFRGRVRVVVGALVAADGIGVVVACIAGVASAWRLVAGLGGLAIFAAGIVIETRGRAWPSMSNRYEREARAAANPTNAWDVIDRGGDPTA